MVWIRKVWKVKKGYLKIHFAVNTKTKQIVSMHVTSEKYYYLALKYIR
jgi:hypothetical protein